MKKEDPRLQGLCKECTHRNSCADAKRYLNVTGCGNYKHWKKSNKAYTQKTSEDVCMQAVHLKQR